MSKYGTFYIVPVKLFDYVRTLLILISALGAAQFRIK